MQNSQKITLSLQGRSFHAHNFHISCSLDHLYCKHFVNRSTEQQRHLAETRTNLRSFLFSDNIRAVSVINPAPLFDGVPVTESWDGNDPIHPRAGIYRELAKLINRNTAYLQGKKSEASAYKDRRDRREDGPPAKRGRDWSSGGGGGRGGWAVGSLQGRQKERGRHGRRGGWKQGPPVLVILSLHPPPAIEYFLFWASAVCCLFFLYLPISEPHWRNLHKADFISITPAVTYRAKLAEKLLIL